MPVILYVVIHYVDTNVLIPPKFKTTIIMTRTEKKRQNSLEEKMVGNTKQLQKKCISWLVITKIV